MSAALAEQLAPLRARMARGRSTVRPISRVSFALSDKVAFERCIRLALEWMESRAQVKFPSEAWQGQNFDVTDVLGANPAKAARIDASDGAVWAARLDWPDPSYSRTWVSEFFTERRRTELTRFGAQLTCVERGESPPYDITRPTVVRHILEELSAEADGWPLSDTISKLNEWDSSSFEELLYDTNRKLPIIAISEDESGVCRINPNALARQVAGSAHIIHLSSEVSWKLTKSLGKRMSVFNGAIRLYLPNLTEQTEDPYQHPLWMRQDGGGVQFIKMLASKVLPLAFLQENNSDNFRRFSSIRDLVARNALAQRPSESENDRANNAIEILQLEFDEAVEERDSWQSLAQEEQQKRLTADAEVERLKADVGRLSLKAAALQRHLDNFTSSTDKDEKLDRELKSYDDLEDWADETLGEHIIVHQAALKDCKKNGHDGMLSRIESALKVMRDYVVPSKMNGGLDRRNLAREKLGEIGMEDTPCFVDRDEAKRTAGYSVKYEGKPVTLFDHIKFGNGYDNANQIRIYYFWDSEKKRLVIGKMPSHLRNNLTS